MILDNICDKRKEQLERDISKVSRQDIKAMSAQKEYQTVSFSKAVKRDTLSDNRRHNRRKSRWYKS